MVNKKHFWSNKKYLLSLLIFIIALVLLKYNSDNKYVLWIIIALLTLDYFYFILWPILIYKYWEYYKLKKDQALIAGINAEDDSEIIVFKDGEKYKYKIYESLITNTQIVKQGFKKIGEIRHEFNNQVLIYKFISFQGWGDCTLRSVDSNGRKRIVIEIINDNKKYEINNNIILSGGREMASWRLVSDGVAIFDFYFPIENRIKAQILIILSVLMC